MKLAKQMCLLDIVPLEMCYIFPNGFKIMQLLFYQVLHTCQLTYNRSLTWPVERRSLLNNLFLF